MSTFLDLQSGDSSATHVIQGFIVGLVIISVVLRLYTRIITKANLWWDNYLIFTAVFTLVLTGILGIWGMHHFQAPRS